MSDTGTLTRPDVELHTGTDKARVAHIVDQRPGSGQDVTLAYVEGTELTALCGHVWIPSRDPDPLPLCDACKTVYDGMKDSLWPDGGRLVGGEP